jgi:hypothetical protein
LAGFAGAGISEKGSPAPVTAAADVVVLEGGVGKLRIDHRLL